MTELDELRHRVHATTWPTVPPSGGEIIRYATARRVRRHRVILVGGAAVAVGALVFGASNLGGMAHEERVTTPPATAPSNDNGLGVAEGYRPVGALGMIFEVPAAWGTNDVACDGSPVADTVTFGFGRDCLILDPPKVSSLFITTEDNRLVAEVLADLTLSPRQIDGVDLEVSPPSQVNELWAFAVADQTGRVALVQAEEENVARHAYRALRAIPDGYVTIPLMPRLSSDEASSELAELGLVPVSADAPASELPPGSVAGTNPPVASVVPIGDEVQLLLAK